MLYLFWFVGLLLIAVSIPLLRRKVKPNSMYGLRVPETLENESVLYEANARSARDMVLVGAANIVIPTALFWSPWLTSDEAAIACSGVLVASVLWCCLRSIRLAKQVKEELS